MVIGDDTLNDGLDTVSSPVSSTAEGDSMNQSSLEMMESIIQRLQPVSYTHLTLPTILRV